MESSAHTFTEERNFAHYALHEWPLKYSKPSIRKNEYTVTRFGKSKLHAKHIEANSLFTIIKMHITILSVLMMWMLLSVVLDTAFLCML